MRSSSSDDVIPFRHVRSESTRNIVCFILLSLIIPPFANDVAAAGFEITPFAGYQWGGEFKNEATEHTLGVEENPAYGIMLDIDLDEYSQIELFFSRQFTRLKGRSGPFLSDPEFNITIDYYHVGGTYGREYGQLFPFAAGSLGITRMDPHEGGYGSETRFSLSLGGGVKAFVTKYIGVRLEARGLGTFSDGSGSIFCRNGNCNIRVHSDMFWQFAVNAGLVFKFQ